MVKIIYGQYDFDKYPLKRYRYDEIPADIKRVLSNLNEKEIAVFRGGLAFIFLLNENQYILKDLDMLALKTSKDIIIEMLACADIVYVNENSFGDTVVTAFWGKNYEYFKLDILLCDIMPQISICIYEGEKKKTISASYIWRNRIEKIAEKEKRKHDENKTLNHYRVAKILCDHLKNNKEEICNDDAKIVAEKINDAKEVLNNLISEQEATNFQTINIQLLRG